MSSRAVMLAEAGRLLARRSRRLLQEALDEDLGSGDRATEALLASRGAPPGRVEGRIVARGDCVVAGSLCAAEVFHLLDEGARYDVIVAEGEVARAGDVVARVAATPLALLGGERTALNLFAHLSGIATATRRVVEAVADTPCRILDTRKTLPGLRHLQKYAHRCGGGVNHRMRLDDVPMIKENHIALAGGLSPALDACRAALGPGARVIVEVENLSQVDEALGAGAEALLLDNMSMEDMESALRRTRDLEARRGRKVWLEASGDMTPERARAAALVGVDFVSLGALTHSSPSANLSLLIER